MTLKNFDKHISEVILERGFNYFKKGYVTELEETEPGKWFAEVEGTDTYSINVELNDTEILYWDCDCPFEGDICKHAVAVFYKLAGNIDSANSIEKKTNSSTNKKDYISLIFQKISMEELKKFLISQFPSNKVLKNSFIAHFSQYIGSDSIDKYRFIVQNIYKTAIGRNDYIDYNSAKRLTRPLADLITKADDLLASRNIPESLAICKILLEEVPLFAHNMDDSDGGIGEILYSVFELFEQIIEIAPPELKDNLFEYFIKEYPKEKYHDYSFNDEILDIISCLISLPEQEEQFINLIHDRMEIEKLKSYPDFGIVRLTKSKIDYLFAKGKIDEAWKLIEENICYTEFRKLIVEKALKNKEYDSAVELCNSGIEIAESNRLTGDLMFWKETLLDIFEKKKDIKNIRDISEDLFYCSYDKIKYYKKLKASYAGNDWEIKCSEIIDKIMNPSPNRSSGDASLLANIYIEENYKDRLLKLMEINSGHIEFIEKFAVHLEKDYPEKIIQLYEQAVKKYAMSTGREYYVNVAHYLKQIKKVKGGDIIVKKIIGQFRTQYKNRRAMIEILNKNFPDS